MKYTDTEVTFIEFPDEISLCINISGCPYRCVGCHSPELQQDIGKELTKYQLAKLIESNNGITCVGFMGGDANPSFINTLAAFVKNSYPNLKVGWYSGDIKISKDINSLWFDYIKIGPYIKEKGGLDNPNTNQRFLAKGKHINKMDASRELLYDITDRFWKHE